MNDTDGMKTADTTAEDAKVYLRSRLLSVFIDLGDFLAQRRQILAEPEILEPAEHGQKWLSPIEFAARGLLLPATLGGIVAWLVAAPPANPVDPMFARFDAVVRPLWLPLTLISAGWLFGWLIVRWGRKNGIATFRPRRAYFYIAVAAQFLPSLLFAILLPIQSVTTSPDATIALTSVLLVLATSVGVQNHRMSATLRDGMHLSGALGDPCYIERSRIFWYVMAAQFGSFIGCALVLLLLATAYAIVAAALGMAPDI